MKNFSSAGRRDWSRNKELFLQQKCKKCCAHILSFEWKVGLSFCSPTLPEWIVSSTHNTEGLSKSGRISSDTKQKFAFGKEGEVTVAWQQIIHNADNTCWQQCTNYSHTIWICRFATFPTNICKARKNTLITEVRAEWPISRFRKDTMAFQRVLFQVAFLLCEKIPISVKTKLREGSTTAKEFRLRLTRRYKAAKKETSCRWGKSKKIPITFWLARLK